MRRINELLENLAESRINRRLDVVLHRAHLSLQLRDKLSVVRRPLFAPDLATPLVNQRHGCRGMVSLTICN